MGQERLLGLALLNVHRDISVAVDHVIERFSNSKRRLLDFVVFLSVTVTVGAGLYCLNVYRVIKYKLLNVLIECFTGG